MSRLSSLTLLVVGSLMLMSNLGMLNFVHIGGAFRTWWPLIMVIIGALGVMSKS